MPCLGRGSKRHRVGDHVRNSGGHTLADFIVRYSLAVEELLEPHERDEYMLFKSVGATPVPGTIAWEAMERVVRKAYHIDD